MVGESDNLTIFQMLELLRNQKVSDLGRSYILAATMSKHSKTPYARAISGTQQIRSQVVLSDPHDLYQVPPPSTFQLFGQRFAIDSFVLSQVVYDSIIYRGEKVKRKMPRGADVTFALGTMRSGRFCSRKWPNSPTHLICRRAASLSASSSRLLARQNLYNIWLDSLAR